MDIDIQLRAYQQECKKIIDNIGSGRYLVQMATGLGKTVTFASINRQGRMLILSHREELVRQPLRYFDCSKGIEMAEVSSSPSDEVVSASVQSLVRRLRNYSPFDFDTIICDEAHHAAAKTYRTIFDYFKPRLLLGFTATPGRGDKIRLDDIFSDIIFSRDLRWGIQNNYLSDISCCRVNIGYDLSSVHISRGDYIQNELAAAMEGTPDAIAQVYKEMAVGATLIFAVSVDHANEIAAKIPGAIAVTGETKNRSDIVEAFTRGDIPCIVNVMVFTEGTDIPRVETIIVARPTHSESLYAQMVGRGLRLFPGKENLRLVDCVGVAGKLSLCTAPSLLGINMSDIPYNKHNDLQGMLLDLPTKAINSLNCPEGWRINTEIVNLWAKEFNCSMHDVDWSKMPDGSFLCPLPDGKSVKIGAVDELGRAMFFEDLIPVQTAFDEAYKYLIQNYSSARTLWDVKSVKRWGDAPATDRQLEVINKKYKDFDTTGLTKAEAKQIISRMFWKKGA